MFRRWTLRRDQALMSWATRRAEVRDSSGNVVFECPGFFMPTDYSQNATDIIASKYARRAGVGGPDGRETSLQEIVDRIAGAIAAAGLRWGHFRTQDDATAFCEELKHGLLRRRFAFNSPVWFNVGLFESYGIATGRGGGYAWDQASDCVLETRDNYSRPQCSACFIQSVDDDLMAIMDLVKDEARIFKFGGGAGVSLDPLRAKGERLTPGGTSSGLRSWAEILDRAAGGIKSGGTTRRAATMRTLRMDHPEIEWFIGWKSGEEKKARALLAAGIGLDRFGRPDFNGEAYATVSGQNSNNSVRVSDDFMRAVESDGSWQLRARTTGEVVKTVRARDLWLQIAEAAWECADPGVQFDTTINGWHTTPNEGPQNSTNPCGEFAFLDNTACNLASQNLVAYLDGTVFDVGGFTHDTRLLQTAMDILVDHASYPTAKIASNSHRTRPLGLGVANLGAMLMRLGLPYDSDAGRAMAAAVVSLQSATAYHNSAILADSLEPFAAYGKNRDAMLAVIARHRQAARDLSAPASLCCGSSSEPVTEQIKRICALQSTTWDEAFDAGLQCGFRNAQISLAAPTGTIGLAMDCDTLGIEPDFALIRWKKLAGGGDMRFVNQSVRPALANLGYSGEQISAILDWIEGTGRLDSPHINAESLQIAGLHPDEVARIERECLSGASSLTSVFSAASLGSAVLAQLGLDPSEVAAGGPAFILNRLGFSDEVIRHANAHIFGRGSVEGAPHLRAEHIAVFDCSNRCAPYGQRMISAYGHVRMIAALQPFLSGAISKTCNLPAETTVHEIAGLYMDAWKMGIKGLTVYRDGCKSSQPLTTAATTTAATATGAIRTSLPQSSGPVRRRLPKKRGGYTQEVSVGGHRLFLRTGEHADGQLGEIFVDMAREGGALGGWAASFARAVSVGLQYGVPLEEYVDMFAFTRFEVDGVVQGDDRIRFCTSPLDWVFRHLGVNYLGRDDLAHTSSSSDATGTGAHVPRPEYAPVPSAPSGAGFCALCGGMLRQAGRCLVCAQCGTASGGCS